MRWTGKRPTSSVPSEMVKLSLIKIGKNTAVLPCRGKRRPPLPPHTAATHTAATSSRHTLPRTLAPCGVAARCRRTLPLRAAAARSRRTTPPHVYSPAAPAAAPFPSTPASTTAAFSAFPPALALALASLALSTLPPFFFPPPLRCRRPAKRETVARQLPLTPVGCVPPFSPTCCVRRLLARQHLTSCLSNCYTGGLCIINGHCYTRRMRNAAGQSYVGAIHVI